MPIPTNINTCVQIKRDKKSQKRYKAIGYKGLKRLECGGRYYCVIRKKKTSEVVCVPSSFVSRWNELTEEEYKQIAVDEIDSD
jgi:hypothetical protein